MAEFVREYSCKTMREYSRDFQLIGDEPGNGYTFPCNSNGEVFMQKLTECARKNYDYCLSHPEIYEDLGAVLHEETIIDHGAVRCHCGTVVDLENRYLGACSCPNCGQWYNLFGQKLVPPEYWEDEEDA